MRSARKLWIGLVIVGCLCILLAIASSVSALVLPSWVQYSTPQSTDFPKSRGLFNACTESSCSKISSPLIETQCNGCSDMDTAKFNEITALRSADWIIQVVAVGIEFFTGFGGIFFLILVRYCMHSPSAQRAQVCLCTCGFIVWFSGILKCLGNIVFILSLTFEALFKNEQSPKLYGVYGNLNEADASSVTVSIGPAMILMWVSVSASLVAGFLWLIASFVQAPAHISPLKCFDFNSSTNPLFSTQKSLNRS